MLPKDNNLSRKNTYFCKVKPFKMSLFRSIPLLALLLAVPFSSVAQDKSPFVHRVLDRLLAPSMELDPAAVYQPEPRWTFALTGDFRQAGISQEQGLTLAEAVIGDDGEILIDEYPATADLRLQGAVENGVGVQVGYGNLGLSLSKTFHGQGTNRTYSFDYQSAGYALQVQFFNLSKPVEYKLTFDGPSGPFPSDLSGFTEEPGRMRALIVDAFYSFNRRTFAFSAAYKGNVVQRRNAGSWMFGTKLSLGDFNLDPSEEIVMMSSGYSMQTSAQISFGGGYSYNFVPLHRQPTGEREKGLRNLTFNLTAIPMVTIFNQFTSTSYILKPGEGYVPIRKSKMNGNLMVNYVYRVGVAYTHELYTFNLSANSDSYSYEGVATIPFAETPSKGVKTSGTFLRWVVGLRVSKRF